MAQWPPLHTPLTVSIEIVVKASAVFNKRSFISSFIFIGWGTKTYYILKHYYGSAVSVIYIIGINL